ncbi:MAG: hypothetical protein U9R27_00150 [Campylobacterota bacterium]|nr:hypothetical protein [Campylobacterota bacterium]
MKKFLWTLPLLLSLFVGCGKERVADIATPAEIEDKDIVLIFPSIPEEFCYADRMTEILDGLSSDINGTRGQVLSINEHVDCSSYGFYNCSVIELESNNKQVEMIECLSSVSSQICLYFLGGEYRDVEGDTFDESCILGVDRQ